MMYGFKVAFFAAAVRTTCTCILLRVRQNGTVIDISIDVVFVSRVRLIGALLLIYAVIEITAVLHRTRGTSEMHF